MSNGTRILTIPRHNPINAFTLGGIVCDAGRSFANASRSIRTANPAFERTPRKARGASPLRRWGTEAAGRIMLPTGMSERRYCLK
jgi:hypothetical protein